jgi:hypothetical protein
MPEGLVLRSATRFGYGAKLLRQNQRVFLQKMDFTLEAA